MFKLFLPLILAFAAFIGSGDVIHACVNNDNGAVRIVSADTDCGGKETALQWGIVGIQGPRGDTGPQGPKGAPGIGDIGCTTEQIADWDGSQWHCTNLPNTAALEARVAQLEDLLQHFSRNNDEITISGANLHVVNGLGNTDTTNRLGNVIIGYNEKRTSTSPGVIVLNPRTGSHMLVVGKEHTYTGFGGIIVGQGHNVSGQYASVSGGLANTASGKYALVSGGSSNTASSGGSSVSGGYQNTASGDNASVSGGIDNTASGLFASVSGGSSNSASSGSSSVSGGINNKAKSVNASVSGGNSNLAGGNSSTVSGGANGVVSGQYDWLAGDLFRED